MTRYPQVLVKIKVKAKKTLAELDEVRSLISEVESVLGNDGRVLVRYSGTESKVRVMVEGPDETAITTYANDIARALEVACNA